MSEDRRVGRYIRRAQRVLVVVARPGAPWYCVWCHQRWADGSVERRAEGGCMVIYCPACHVELGGEA